MGDIEGVTISATAAHGQGGWDWGWRVASRGAQVDLAGMQQTSVGPSDDAAPILRTGRFTIRPFGSTEDYKECIRLQEATWGAGFSERVGASILRVSQRLGGLAAGAYDEDGELAGFVFGMTGLESGRVVHWSDMLAVREGSRDAGLGRVLKVYQRDVMRARGVDTILWTFDPLEAKNAYFNVVKLGATSHEYVEDMYGETDSPLHRGIGSDRLIARWVVGVGTPLGGGDEAVGAARALGPRPGSDPVLPDEPDLSVDSDRILVAIPSDVQALKDLDPDAAAAWRTASRAALSGHLARGYAITGFARGEATSDYVLARVSDSGESA